MKRIFNKFREKIAFKESPPPYSVNDNAGSEEHVPHERIGPVCEVLDLLADCKITPAENNVESEEYAEIKDMGLWHSSPLAHRHKSKISLTWVLRDNLESSRLPIKKIENQSDVKSVSESDRPRLRLDERPRKCSREVRDRVVGRNEYYHNLRFRSAFEQFVNGNSCSDDTSAEECARKKHRHRHRRKKKSRHGKFGYDIKDLDSFLSEASIDRPGNIPVVVAYPSTLHQTAGARDAAVTLPLGTVVNAVFKSQHWLYAQTPHGEEGYVLYAACLPLGILPPRPSPQKKTPCWESSTDLYPRPCGNLTDTEKEQLRGRARSEPRPRRRASAAERHFDSLYLRTKSVNSLHKESLNKEKLHNEQLYKDKPHKTPNKDLVERRTLLVVTADYTGDRGTLSVSRGDVVVLLQRGGDDWFYVRDSAGASGYIPAAVAGHGYI